MSSADTIVALSSGRLPAGIAVVRLSGPETFPIVTAVTGSLPPPRQAALRVFRGTDGEKLDSGLCIVFSGPASFTGEDCAELHCHGSKATVQALLRVICSFPRCRLADPGEFSRRALANGKTSLLEVEAVADLIGSETEAQRRFAVANADGRQRSLYETWRTQLIAIRARIEAELDFADEDDVPDGVAQTVWDQLRDLKRAISDHAAGYAKAEIIRDGMRVVLAGAPNAGKSSLLNALAGRDVAIVTPEPGTTRDTKEVAVDLGGNKVVFVDTAGIRDAESTAERIGVVRAREEIQRAELVLWLHDLTQADPPVPPADALIVGTKADLSIPPSHTKTSWPHAISTVTGEGLDELLGTITSLAERWSPRDGEILPWRLRHIEAMQRATIALEAAGAEHQSLELSAELLRSACQAIEELLGRIDSEHLLDVVFAEFCIGK